MKNHQLDISEFPESVLKNSPTWMKYADECGMCRQCKEWTGVLSTCCNATVAFEGGDLDASELWNEIESEIEHYYAPDPDQRKLTQEEVDAMVKAEEIKNELH